MNRRPSPTTIIAGMALFFSLAGTGIAASHYVITSLSQIKPQVRHQLRGEQGPAGEQGRKGEQGLSGPSGPSTQPTFPIHTGDPVTIAPGQTATATASCVGTTERVLAGGFDGDPGLNVYSSKAVRRSDPRDVQTTEKWSVTATNPTDQSLTLTASATCVYFYVNQSTN